MQNRTAHILPLDQLVTREDKTVQGIRRSYPTRKEKVGGMICRDQSILYIPLTASKGLAYSIHKHINVKLDLF